MANFGTIFDGTIWQRLRQPASDGQSVTGIPASGGMHFNGTTWDRERGNEPTNELLAMAARTSTNTSTQTNYNARGLILHVDVDVVGTGDLRPAIRFSSGAAPVMFPTIAAGNERISTIGEFLYIIYPGVTGTDIADPGGGAQRIKKVFNGVLPRTWRCDMSVSDGSTWTYSVSCQHLL